MNAHAVRLFPGTILAGLFLLMGIGCSTGTNSSTGSVTTQPIAFTPPAVPAGWVNIDRPYASYSYPIGWQLTESTSATQPYIEETDPAGSHEVFVEFVPGFVNKASATNQCYDVENYLRAFYTTNFLPYATAPATKYPRITVTYTGPDNYGSLGGSVMYVTIMSQQTPGGTGVSTEIELQGVPHADGLYVVGIWNPDYFTSSFYKTFISTVWLKYNKLPAGAYCSF